MSSIQEREQYLHELLSSDPLAALQEARSLGASSDEIELKSGIFIDAGLVLQKPAVIRAGVLFLKKLCERYGPDTHRYYSIANGLSAYSELYDGVHQSAETKAALDREARAYYGKALLCQDDVQLRSQAATNIANHLSKRGRYVEAIDYYQKANRLLPQNAVAACGELSLLKQCGFLIHHEAEWYRFYGDFEALLRRCMKLRTILEENFGYIAVLAGSEHQIYAARLIEDTPHFDLPLDNFQLEPYEMWVRENRLALSLFCSNEEYHNKRYDLLSVPSFSGDFEDGPEVPDVFRMMNIIKSDYVLARRLAFEGLNEGFDETANYADTLDYATYGINITAIASAQKMSMDILDKISVVVATLLDLPSPEFFKFKKVAFWRKQKSTAEWHFIHEEVKYQIEQGNVYMSAFLDMVSDLYDRDEGYLSHLTSLRNFSTHRFLSVHDMGLVTSDQEKRYVGHMQHDEVVEGAIKSLRLARSCLFYLLDFIKSLETQKISDGDLTAPLTVPDHHWIRGDNEL